MNSDNKLFKHLTGVSLGTLIILLIPLIAMQFTDEVVWTLGDFVFAGILLFGTGTALILATAKFQSLTYKMGIIIGVISIFLLVWVNGAVGIVGHEGEPINVLYFIIPAVGLVGSFLCRLNSQGMFYTLSIMALIPMIIAVIAILGYMQEPPHNTAMQILSINAFFTILFSLSAISFRNAAQDEIEARATENPDL